MDENTRRTLNNISARTPQKGQLTKTVVDKEMEDVMRDRLKHDKTIRPRLRRKLEVMIEKGDFRHAEEVLDEKTIAQIDKYQTRAVNEAISSGAIPPPESDPFVKERMHRQKKGKFAIVGDSVVKPGIGRILVEPVVNPTQKPAKKSLILLPANVKGETHQTVFGVVRALGPELYDSRGKMKRWEVEVGDCIVYREYGFDFIQAKDGEMLHIVEFDSLLGKIL